MRPENEWLRSDRKDLIIIDKELWEKAQKRWQSLKGTWPVRRKTKNSSIKQQSYIHSSPSHLFSGIMKCQCCGGAIILIGGAGNGYYGCFNAKRKTCNNKLLVPRNRVEKAIIADLKEKLLTLENLSYVYGKVEKLVFSGMNEVPELIKKKKSENEKVLQEMRNYLNYIKTGNFSKAVSGALKEDEMKSENLKEEIKSLEFQRQNTFKAPPKEWIKDRLENLHQTLAKNTCSSASALKSLLGTIQLEPVSDRNEDFYSIVNGEKKFKPYYIAHTKIQTLAVLDDRHKVSNWSRWWRRRESNPRPVRCQQKFLHA